MNFFEIRKEIYDYHRKNYPYVFSWPWYSYRRYKMLYYMEGASLISWILLKTGIKPNNVTLAYLAANMTAGILLALPIKTAVLAGALMMLIMSVLDSVDGALARIKKMTSLAGHVLDSYGGLVWWVSLWTGLGLYLGNTTNRIFYYLSPVIPAIFAMNIHVSARETFIHHGFLKNKNNTEKTVEDDGSAEYSKSVIIRKVKDCLNKVFEHNARTTDFICFLVILELFTQIKIVWIVYSAFLVWQVFTFFVRIYMVSSRAWAEGELNRIQGKIHE